VSLDPVTRVKKTVKFHRTLVVRLIVETAGNPPIVRHIRINPFKR